jgi:hypothetical protein
MSPVPPQFAALLKGRSLEKAYARDADISRIRHRIEKTFLCRISWAYRWEQKRIKDKYRMTEDRRNGENDSEGMTENTGMQRISNV